MTFIHATGPKKAAATSSSERSGTSVPRRLPCPTVQQETSPFRWAKSTARTASPTKDAWQPAFAIAGPSAWNSFPGPCPQSQLHRSCFEKLAEDIFVHTLLLPGNAYWCCAQYKYTHWHWHCHPAWWEISHIRHSIKQDKVRGKRPVRNVSFLTAKHRREPDEWFDKGSIRQSVLSSRLLLTSETSAVNG